MTSSNMFKQIQTQIETDWNGLRRIETDWNRLERIETDWKGFKQIETVGNGVNSDGACARRKGAQPSSRERAAAGGPAGRVPGPIV